MWVSRKGGLSRCWWPERLGSRWALCPPPSFRKWLQCKCMFVKQQAYSRATSLDLFARPGTSLQCCHGEVTVIVLLATGYLSEHQTAQPGPVSNGPGAVAIPTVPWPLCPSPLTPSSTPLPSQEAEFILVHKDTRHGHLHEEVGIHGPFLLLIIKSMTSHGQSCLLPQPQLKCEQLSEEKLFSTYFYWVSHCHNYNKLEA